MRAAPAYVNHARLAVWANNAWFYHPFALATDQPQNAQLLSALDRNRIACLNTHFYNLGIFKMPFYNDLRPARDDGKQPYSLVFPDMDNAERRRTIDGLLTLKTALNEQITPQLAGRNLIIASWNIKQFGELKRRRAEAFFYIAETIARFDLVVIQEVQKDQSDLERLMRLLGSGWDYVINDSTDGRAGNSESSAFLFNTARVKPTGTVGELVLWQELVQEHGTIVDTATQKRLLDQIQRTPFFMGLQAGWKRFTLLSLHLQPGDSADDQVLRREEVRLLLAALAEKADERWMQNLFLTGDFNFYDSDDGPNIADFNASGYTQPEGLIGKDTTASGAQAYDRFFLKRGEYFKPQLDNNGQEIAGVFDIFEHVLREDQVSIYHDHMRADKADPSTLSDDDKLAKYFHRYWKVNQLSDHLPIWFAIDVDSSEDFLIEKRAELVG